MRRRSGESEADHIKRLMALPIVNPARPLLRDCVPWTGKTLAARAKKFATASAFQTAPKPRWWEETNPHPIYPAWTKGTRQATPLPFESGPNTLPGMEGFV